MVGVESLKYGDPEYNPRQIPLQMATGTPKLCYPPGDARNLKLNSQKFKGIADTTRRHGPAVLLPQIHNECALRQVCWPTFRHHRKNGSAGGLRDFHQRVPVSKRSASTGGPGTFWLIENFILFGYYKYCNLNRFSVSVQWLSSFLQSSNLLPDTPLIALKLHICRAIRNKK